nr:hypothetical protein [Fimbriiglobus ruber]
MPHRRHPLGQLPDGLPVRVPEYPRLGSAEPVELVFQPSHLPEQLVPAVFQGPGHQAVLRLTGVVLPGRSIRVVFRPLDSLLPVAGPLLALPLDRARGRQAGLQGGRLPREQHLLGHPPLDFRGRGRLAHRPRVIGPVGATHVGRPSTGPPVPDVHPLAAPPTPANRAAPVRVAPGDSDRDRLAARRCRLIWYGSQLMYAGNRSLRKTKQSSGSSPGPRPLFGRPGTGRRGSVGRCP